jgi:predicted nucleic acid-binding protein
VKALAPDFLVDAGPLVGWLDGSDQWHEWSVRSLRVLPGPLVTTETAFAEACHHLRELRPALDVLLGLVEQGDLVLVPAAGLFAARIRTLLERYPKMDLGDASLVALSEKHPRARLVTLDRRDFTVYRRNDGKPVPCVLPPV